MEVCAEMGVKLHKVEWAREVAGREENKKGQPTGCPKEYLSGRGLVLFCYKLIFDC